ncbi:uncharacterized protein LOC135376003 [Ornithodoros turicata]|uniref:uncharacterized protein LOC135376003 n=1 Tax=Ornithodoros turicata TaxID=34597 RepID=UPI003139CE58
MSTHKSYAAYRRHVSNRHNGLLKDEDPAASTSQDVHDEGGQQLMESADHGVDHSQNVNVESDANEVSGELNETFGESQVTEMQEFSPMPDPVKSMSLLFLKWKEGMRLPEATVSEIANDIILYLQQFVQQSSDMPSGALVQDVIKELPALQTKSGREQYWQSTLPYVTPTTIVLDKKPNGKAVTYQYISILKVLKKYLQSPNASFRSGQRAEEGRLASVSDGSAFRDHKYFQGDTSKLCIQLYTDEFEPCDPLAAKKGETQANVVKEKAVEQYGLHRILEALVKEIVELETEGIVIDSTKYTGSVLCLTGDNLSSHRAGGFSCGFSHGRVCRFCMAVHRELSVKHSERDFVLRSPQGHKYHLEMLENGLPALSLYGVKSQCALTFEGFEPTEHLPPDLMHDLHEGVIPFVLKHVLFRLVIQDKCFTLETLNKCIETFAYDPCDAKNKPEPVARTALVGKGTLRGSASQKFSFLRHLALYIGECVSSENRAWKIYLLLREVVDLLMCRDIPVDHIPYLYRRIVLFRQEFESVFPGVKVPCKMHYLLHYPSFIYKYGPLVALWSMRYEAKHQYFKDVARKIKNFKNIAFSLAHRHQLYQMFVWTQHTLEDAITTVASKTVVLEHAPEPLRLYLASSSGQEQHICSMKSVTVNARTYTTGCVVTQLQEDDLPDFYEVCGIYAVNRRVTLFLRRLVTEEFDTHLFAYVVSRSQEAMVTDRLSDFLSDLQTVHRKEHRDVVNPRQALL